MELGFIVGKFYPPHRGHHHLIRTARQQVDRLLVMIAEHPNQTIPGMVRQQWLRHVHPDCDIRLVPDTLPEEPIAWAGFTRTYLGRSPDKVFTSEEYGQPFATAMGCQHVLVDLKRSHVPISGTQVREAPWEYAEFLEPCVRAWFVKRIVLIGAESTGKTTLAQALAKHYRTPWVAEFGREHWEKKLQSQSMEQASLGWTDHEFVEIACEQQARENELAMQASGFLFCDTNAFATGTWYERYRNARHRWIDQLGRCSKSDLYLVTSPDVPFVQDGFRDGENIRHWMHHRFLEQLQQHNLPYAVIHGPFEGRFNQALTLLEERFPFLSSTRCEP